MTLTFALTLGLAYIRSELEARRLPPTAILGTPDAEPFVPPDQRYPHVKLLPAAEFHSRQASAGATTSRADLIRHDAALPLSLSQLAPPALAPASSSYSLDVLPHSGDSPLLSIYHMDSGGGGARQQIHSSQVTRHS